MKSSPRPSIATTATSVGGNATTAFILMMTTSITGNAATHQIPPALSPVG